MSCVVLLVYRPGSESPSAQFFQEFSDALDRLELIGDVMTIIGDFSVHLHRESDPAAVQLTALLASHGLVCRVQVPTHQLGGLLDIVATRDNLPVPAVAVVDVGLSDHHLLQWSTSSVRPTPVYTTTVCRSWHHVSVDDFRDAI